MTTRGTKKKREKKREKRKEKRTRPRLHVVRYLGPPVDIHVHHTLAGVLIMSLCQRGQKKYKTPKASQDNSNLRSPLCLVS